MHDALVLGAGLAGMSAARDLKNAGVDVVVLEGRDRPGGRVEGVRIDDGRTLQGGGEVFGAGHTAYRGLADELGLAVTSSYVGLPGEMSWGMVDGVFVGDTPPWMTDEELADSARTEQAFVALSRTVDPYDPWSHPEAAKLDAMSISDWLRTQNAMPAVHRRHVLASLSLSDDSPERTSLLSELRKHAVLGGDEFYELDRWEGFKLADGSAALVDALAAELDPVIRFERVVTAIDVDPNRVTVTLADGEVLEAKSVVCALPIATLREVAVTGLSAARQASLDAQRGALAAKVVVAYGESFWHETGQDGLSECEWLFGSTWQQQPGALSLLVPPERFAAFIAAPPKVRRETVLASLRALYGEKASEPVAMFERLWGIDPLSRCYVASYAPGDLMRIGPLHGTHEPPFYVAGSDHWAAGYMEGAVYTGRGAAEALLGA